VGGEMKLGQTFKFGPFGIDQFEFHRHILYLDKDDPSQYIFKKGDMNIDIAG